MRFYKRKYCQTLMYMIFVSMKTAIEWLVEQLARKHNEFQALTFYYDHKEEIEQAKAMEKEQICNAYVEGLEGLWISAEEYYNREFNQNK